MVPNSNLMPDQEIDRIMRDAVIENTAQGVLHKLEELERNRAHVLTRWVWELLQNARDAAAGPDTRLVASIVINDKEREVIFRHNGANFRIEEIAHLIYHGSTKIEQPEAIGQYGSGFLATHLLSPEVEIAGQLNDGRQFKFTLRREAVSVAVLSKSMAQAQDDFKASLSPSATTSDFTTQFRYKYADSSADAVERGIVELERCAPFVVAFNREFSEIAIEFSSRNVQFKVVERRRLERDNLQQIKVSKIENAVAEEIEILLAHNEKTSVAFPLAAHDTQQCLPVKHIPRLFLGFPLIGTEDFSFPAVINSFDFTPTENRDGVYIGRSNNEANVKNQDAVGSACELILDMLHFLASSGWRNTYHLANVPAIPQKSWLDQNWLRTCIESSLIGEIRRNHGVLNEAGDVISAEDVELPMAQTAEGVETLHGLLYGWRKRRDKMPSPNEAIGWADAVKSWARISECEFTAFDEVTDGRKLAAEIESTTLDPSVSTPTYQLSRLQDLLMEGLSGVEWLDQFHGFLKAEGSFDVIRDRRIVPSQIGFLGNLQQLHRDNDIDDELKNIADLMDDFRVWRIRAQLRDSRLTFVKEETGSGDWDNDYVVGELIKKIKEQSEESLDGVFARASVRLFAWLCDHDEWNLLRDFPVFAKEGDTESLRVIKLVHDPDNQVRTLAPTGTWSADLQRFAELFPRRNIIADDFFAATPCEQVWLTLTERGLCRRDVIVRSKTKLNTFLPNEPLSEEDDHETSTLVDVTNLAFLSQDDTGIMARVRSSQRLARKFWRFLTEWMTVHDSKGLEPHESVCDCGESHHYYPAAWLGPLQRNKWIPVPGPKRGQVAVTAQTLADLLRGSGWEPGSLNANPAAIKLLEAIGITHFDLVRAFAAETEEERVQQDNILTGLLDAARGETEHLDHARRYIEYLKDDEALPQVLEDRQKRREAVKRNQTLGKQVERLVRESLEGECFVVRRKPIGSDFEIEHDVIDGHEESVIEVETPNRTWLVEVKATRIRAVRMTERQANTAKQEGARFLLCVVPFEDDEQNLTLEDVRAKIRFVQGIGRLVAPLCDNLDEFREMRESITDSETSAVQLIVDSGTVRVQVGAVVWESEGFPLEDLLGRLSAAVQ